MDSSRLPGMRLQQGPGARRNECPICATVFEADAITVIHGACENTFHKSCLDDWADCLYQQRRVGTCPLCRISIGDPLEMRHIMKSHDLNTSEDEMWDFDLNYLDVDRCIMLSPGMVHRWYFDKAGADAWLLDFFTRLRWAQNLSIDQARCRLCFYIKLLRNADPYMEMFELRGAVAPGEALTDLEIIDRHGNRRPRDSLVVLYRLDTNEAQLKIRERMVEIRQTLGLSFESMNRFIQRFEAGIRAAIVKQEADGIEPLPSISRGIY